MRICVAYHPSIGQERYRRLLLEECPSAEVVWTELGAEEYEPACEALLIMTQAVGSKAPRTLLPKRALLEKLKVLKLIATASTGYSHIDAEFCRERGIAVYAVPDYATASVAELAVAGALHILRNLSEADASVKRGDWDLGGVTPGAELYGKTVGIIGTGTIGLATARLFAAFGCNLIGWSRNQNPDFLKLGGEYRQDLTSIARDSDIVSIHLALADETSKLIGAEFINQMRSGAILINASRGGLIDGDALEAALDEGRIGGAVLDVFDTEPLDADASICRFKNVLLTPHLGFKTKEALERLDIEVIRNVGRFLRGDASNRVI